jgi:Xaa-Pro aminopeptidase
MGMHRGETCERWQEAAALGRLSTGWSISHRAQRPRRQTVATATRGDGLASDWQTGRVSSATLDTSVYLDRLARVRAAMTEQDVDAVLLSVGHDLPYLTGYMAMPLERLTMLVLPRDGDATMLIPGLEAARVEPQPGVFNLLPWGETEDPSAMVGKLTSNANRIAVGDQMWARFLVELLPHTPNATFTRAVDVVGPLRMSKDQAELDALAAAGAAVDLIAGELQRGEIPLVGRTEAEVSAHLSRRIIEEGHQKVNFAIVAAGENASSPHHHPGDRVIQPNEIVLTDFGGTMNGYCSDTTRCVFTGEIAADVAEAYEVLFASQAAGVAAATVGTPCEDVDRACRSVIDDAGYGEYFIHRTGHGIGLEAHEDPYIIEGNKRPLEAGHAFSVEPGIYIPGKWGMRLEDIAASTAAGPVSFNNSDHHLISVDA